MGETHTIVGGDTLSLQVVTGETHEVKLVVRGIEQKFPWDQDIRNELYTHPKPYAPKVWRIRSAADVKFITIHHTLSDSPHVTFRNYCQAKGRPTGPYTFWVTQDGRVLYCVNLKFGVWHDHSGRNWEHLSVGMAGKLHEYLPAEIQLLRTTRFCGDLIRSSEFPRLTGVEDVTGHMDWKSTQCPGWVDDFGNDRWKTWFYDELKKELT